MNRKKVQSESLDPGDGDSSKKRKYVCQAAIRFNINQNNALCTRSEECCDFCENTFQNKLEALVHNSRHIVIPLSRNCGMNADIDIIAKEKPAQTISQSMPAFNNNKIILGTKKPKPLTIQNEKIFEVEEDEDTILISDSESDNGNKVNTEEHQANILNSFVGECKVVLSDTMALFKIENPLDCNVPIKTQGENEKSLAERSKMLMLKREEKLRKRNKKEMITKMTNQFENMSLPVDQTKSLEKEIKHVTFDPNINIKIFSQEEESTGFFQVKEVKAPDATKLIKQPPNTETVHYDELQKPGLFKCDLCKLTFPNKYGIIQHRTQHLQIRKAKGNYCIVCEKIDAIPNPEIPLCQNCTNKHRRHKEQSLRIVDRIQFESPEHSCKRVYSGKSNAKRLERIRSRIKKFCIASHKIAHAKVKIMSFEEEIKRRAPFHCDKCHIYFITKIKYVQHNIGHIGDDKIREWTPSTNWNSTEEKRMKFERGNKPIKTYPGKTIAVCTSDHICMQEVKFQNLPILRTSNSVEQCHFCLRQVKNSMILYRQQSDVKSSCPPIPTKMSVASVGQNAPSKRSSVKNGDNIWNMDSAALCSTSFGRNAKGKPLRLPPPPNGAPEFKGSSLLRAGKPLSDQSNTNCINPIDPNESESECVLGF